MLSIVSIESCRLANTHHANLFSVLSPVKFRKAFQYDEEKDVYKKLKAVVERVLASSSYSEVNLAKLFQAFTSLK